MLKRIFSVLVIYLCASVPCFASSVIGYALNDFSTNEPSSTFTLQIDENITIDGYQTYEKGTMFSGRVIKVVNGRRGKRTGYFVVNPTHYAGNDRVAKEMPVHNLAIKVSYYAPFSKKDAKKIVTSGATSAAGMIFHVPLLSQGISFVKGLVNSDDEDSAIIDGVKQVYKDSPLSYIEKGNPLVLKTGQKVKLDFSEESY